MNLCSAFKVFLPFCSCTKGLSERALYHFNESLRNLFCQKSRQFFSPPFLVRCVAAVPPHSTTPFVTFRATPHS